MLNEGVFQCIIIKELANIMHVCQMEFPMTHDIEYGKKVSSLFCLDSSITT